MSCIRKIDQSIASDGSRMGCFTLQVLAENARPLLSPHHRATLELAKRAPTTESERRERHNCLCIRPRATHCGICGHLNLFFFEAVPTLCLPPETVEPSAWRSSRAGETGGKGRKIDWIGDVWRLLYSTRSFATTFQPSTSIAAATTFRDTISFLYHPHGVADTSQIAAFQFQRTPDCCCRRLRSLCQARCTGWCRMLLCFSFWVGGVSKDYLVFTVKIWKPARFSKREYDSSRFALR